MHQLSHFKWIRMQSFGRRKLDFLYGAKQGKQKMNSCMDVPTHWISHLSTQLVCRFGTWNHFSTLKIGNAKDNCIERRLSLLGDVTLPLRVEVPALGWAHHMHGATVK